MREREAAATICRHWAGQLEEMRDAVVKLANVLEDDVAADGSHEITAISEAQDTASALQAACNALRTGTGRAFPTRPA